VALSITGKVILDTNVFVDYLRDDLHKDWVLGRVPNTVRFLSAIVLMELRLGADTPVRKRKVDGIERAFPSHRILAPEGELFGRAGSLFRTLYGFPTGDRLGHMNDILIALTAWRIGATVVTNNLDDFRRLGRHLNGLLIASPT
jgi:predicted nucleic acid-binding protein